MSLTRSFDLGRAVAAANKCLLGLSHQLQKVQTLGDTKALEGGRRNEYTELVSVHFNPPEEPTFTGH